MAFYKSKKKQEDPIKQKFIFTTPSNIPSVAVNDTYGCGIRIYFDPTKYTKLKFTAIENSTINNYFSVFGLYKKGYVNPTTGTDSVYGSDVPLQDIKSDIGDEFDIVSRSSTPIYQPDYVHFVDLRINFMNQDPSSRSFSISNTILLSFELVP